MMLARGRSKLRRRDIAAPRRFQAVRTDLRTVLPSGLHHAASSKSVELHARLLIRVAPRPVECKTILRFDGDSIAYFWALESETAISHKVLRGHWQELANAWMVFPSR